PRPWSPTMRQLLACLPAVLLLATPGSPGAATPDRAGDWPQWRGPQRNGICSETGLLKEWPKGGPRLLWDSRKVNGGPSVGTGFSSLAVAGGKIFTQGDRSGRDGGGYVFCLDADSGKEVWKARVGPAEGDGPRSTPTVDGDRVYALTRQGLLACLKA